MATLTLTKTFITLVATGTSVSGQTARDRGEKYEIAIDVRTYAGGRSRAVSQVGEVGTYTTTLILVPRATVDTLRSWEGLLVQVRDHKGRQFFGVFNSITVAEYVSRMSWDVTLTLTTVTFDPSV
jgi:hypothetical protein